MKLYEIIKKNVKLLLRSKIATIVLLLAPLLVLLLVGLSFSTNSFNLNIGVYSESYSNLSSSFVNKLQAEGYAMTSFSTEQNCIDSVKEGISHACIIFPPDLQLNNEGSSQISFHVDQSKVNLVYLVMSTLTSSFEERTTEISRELTDEIVGTLFDAKTSLTAIEDDIEDIRVANEEIIISTATSEHSLNTLDLEASISVSSDVDSVSTEIDTLLDDSLLLLDDGYDLIDDIDPYVSGNGSQYLDDLEDKLDELNSTIKEGHNTSLNKLNVAVSNIETSLDSLSEKLQSAKSTSSEVVAEIQKIRKQADVIAEKNDQVKTSVSSVISKINSVQITNSENIVAPITTDIHPVVSSQNNLSFLFPNLIVMLILFIGLIMPSSLIIMEKKSKAYFRNFTTPTRGELFVFGTYITSLMLLAAQIMIIMVIAQFVFKMAIFDTFFLLIISLLVIISLFIFMGMLIGYIFNSEEMAMIAAVSLASLLLLTSGIIFPLESMPTYLKEKAEMNPVVVGNDIVKKMVFFDTPALKDSLIYLLLVSLILLAVILTISKLERLKLILGKPAKMRNKRRWLNDQFVFGDRKAKNLPEFIVSIQNMDQEKYLSLRKENAIKDWLILVARNRSLADKIEGLKRQQLIDTLIEELKKINE